MIKKGDTVIVITGADKGKKGVVTRSFPKTSQVTVEGVRVVKKHQKATTRDGVGKVIEITKPIHVSNVKKV